MSDEITPPWRKRRASEHIGLKAARNLHHAIRLAESKRVPFNTAVSVNLSLTGCRDVDADLVFRKVRDKFGKWLTRPPRSAASLKASPSYVYAIENQAGCLNVHWLLHLPAARLKEFREKLTQWLTAAAGDIYSPGAIDIRPAYAPKGFGRYMLKGMKPVLARHFAIEPEDTGWVTGRRCGHSRNLGPVQLRSMRGQGLHPPAQRWRQGKYDRTGS